MDFSQIEKAAGEADKVLKQVMQYEPMIVGALGTFVPGAALAQPAIMAIIPAVEKALEAVEAGNGGNTIDAISQVIKHLIPSLPNSPILSGNAAT